MVVMCPVCGSESHDLEFCDHCNADLAPRPAPVVPARCPLRADVDLTDEELARLAQPEGSTIIAAGDQAWRVHWIGRTAWDSWQPLVEARQRYDVRPLAPCRLIEEDAGIWVAAECSWRRFEPWTEFYFHDPV